MPSFQDIMKSQITSYENRGNFNSSTERRKPKNGNILTLGKSAAEYQTKYHADTVYYRIIPYEENHFFATPVKQVFLSIPKKSGELMSVIFYSPQPESGVIPEQWSWDPETSDGQANLHALDLINQVVNFNKEYRMDHPESGAVDRIALSNSNGKKSYPTTIQKRYYVSVIRALFGRPKNAPANAPQTMMYEQNTDAINNISIPNIRILQLPETAYIPVVQRIERQMDLTPERQPFPTELGFIDKDYAVPLSFTQNSQQYNLDVAVQYTTKAPLPANYLDRASNDADFDYTMFDNPAYYVRPTEGDFLNNVIIPFLEKKVKEINTLQEPAGNQYAQGMPQQPYVNNQAMQAHPQQQVQAAPQAQSFAQPQSQPQPQPAPQQQAQPVEDPFAANQIESVPEDFFNNADDALNVQVEQPTQEPASQPEPQTQPEPQAQSFSAPNPATFQPQATPQLSNSGSLGTANSLDNKAQAAAKAALEEIQHNAQNNN